MDMEFKVRVVDEKIDTVELYSENEKNSSCTNNGVCGDVDVNVGVCA